MYLCQQSNNKDNLIIYGREMPFFNVVILNGCPPGVVSGIVWDSQQPINA